MTITQSIFWISAGVVAFCYGAFQVGMTAAGRAHSAAGPWILLAGLAVTIYGIVCAVLATRRQQRTDR
jgi:hypothetical protein